MSYTNSTPNYKLPQWIASDKPTYLVDQNSAYLTIDSTMKQISVKADDAVTTATTATNTADNALNSANNNAAALIVTNNNLSQLNATVNALGTNAVSFTPELVGTSGEPTYNVQKGIYDKINKLVNVTMQIAISSANNLTGNIKVKLPTEIYPNATVPVTFRVVGDLVNVDEETVRGIYGAITSSTNNMIELRFEKYRSGTHQYLTAENLQANTTLYISGTYIAK